MSRDDLRDLRTTGQHVESAVRPPEFEQLVLGAGQRKQRRRALSAGVLAFLIVAGGSTVAALGRGSDQTRTPVSPPTTTPTLPDVTRTVGTVPTGASTTAGNRAPASVRAHPIIAASTRLMALKVNAAGLLFEAFAGCPDPTTCESAWRLVDPVHGQVARGILTGGLNVVTPYSGGFVITDPSSGFSVGNDGLVTQFGAPGGPMDTEAGDVILPSGKDVPVAYRPKNGRIYQVVVASQPKRPAAWSTAALDDRGALWVLGGGQDGATTTVFHSSDQGRTWTSHDLGPGVPGDLVLTGDTIHVVTTGNCTLECIVNGSTSTDHGKTWTMWPRVSNRYLIDLAAGQGDRLFLRTGDTTATSGAPQVLVLSRPATGMVDLPGWHPKDPPGDSGLLTASGSTLWFALDASTLMRSTDAGRTWTEIPAR